MTMPLMTVDAEALQQTYELDVFGKRGITLVRGSGVRLEDAEGRSYLDCIGGHGSANLGHSHPHLIEAIQDQLGRLMCCPGAFSNDVRARYLEALVHAAPPGMERAFLCNSGTEAVEAALKFARLSTGRARFVAARRAFHGRTFGAMSATFNPHYSKGCEPLVPGFCHIPFNDIEALRQNLDTSVAGLILEIVQGEGGVRVAEAAFLAEARALCDAHGVLLIIDEVQTGFGRTGALFACSHFDLRPDLLCLAKSIAGGLPMGAVVVNGKVEVEIGKHGTTFGGNPLACAAALATLTILAEEDLCSAAAEKGRHFKTLLQSMSHLSLLEVRGLGLMIGVEVRGKAKPYLEGLAARGILALPAGPNVVRFLPPLTISLSEIEQVVDAFRKVVEEVGG